MDDSVFTPEKQIQTVQKGNRHVVILGAGASIATVIHNHEKNERILPSMDNLIEVLDLEPMLKDTIKQLNSRNFELIFSHLYKNNSDLLESLETKVYNYFDQLDLPDSPTIYDHLVLSLRKKDLIATFNWDPLLWKAYQRNLTFTRNLPTIAFLHGNVAIGVCEEDKSFGPKNLISLKSDKPFMPTNLLYPIDKKNYTNDPFISAQWDLLSQGLTRPSRVTIFGYSAPKSDVEAIKMMKRAYGAKENQRFTQFEIIDVKTDDELSSTWEDFIFSHHYEVHNNFFDSTIAMYPRRTGEVFWANYLETQWTSKNLAPQTNSLDELWDWFSRFLRYEN